MNSLQAYRGMAVLVTGGAGFIGSHLTRALVDAGAQVRVLDNLSNGSRDNLDDVADRIDLQVGDITNLTDCETAATSREVVFHLAALGSVPRSVEQPILYHQVNTTGTLNVLEAARQAGVKRLVYSASSSAYGDTPILPKVETMLPNPKSPYAATKLAGEYNARVYAAVYGLQTVSLRYFNVFGPRQNPNSQYAAVIPAFITALLKGERPRIYGDGEQSRDFCPVENVVLANLLAGATPKAVAGESINIACGQRITLNAMLKRMQEILGVDVPPHYLPPRMGDVRDSLADIGAAKMLIDYAPELSFDAALPKTVDWYAQHTR